MGEGISSISKISHEPQAHNNNPFGDMSDDLFI